MSRSALISVVLAALTVASCASGGSEVHVTTTAVEVPVATFPNCDETGQLVDVFIGATRTVRDVGSGWASVETSEDLRLASFAALEGVKKLAEDAVDLGRLTDEASDPDVAAAAEENAVVLLAISANFLAVVDAVIADDLEQLEAATSEMLDLHERWFTAAAKVGVLVDDCPDVQRSLEKELASLGVSIVSDDPTATPQTTASSTTISEVTAVESAGAEATLTLFQGLSRNWNENALTWVAAYSDPNVGWEDFLRVQQDVLVAQARLVAVTDLQVSQLPPDVQGPANDVVEHYQHRLDAFDRWARAIVAGDLAAEEAAAAEYNSISNVSVIIPLLEELFRAPTIRSALQAEGASPDDLLDALLGAVPER